MPQRSEISAMRIKLSEEILKLSNFSLETSLPLPEKKQKNIPMQTTATGTIFEALMKYLNPI
ncbi:MAG: hypothetical protein LUD81_07250 [Clostridiales bacterium]|nr:hypothetical protein [Clostridiales bacterium]